MTNDKVRAISPIAMAAQIPWHWRFERLFVNIVSWIMVHIFRRGKNLIRIRSLGHNQYADKDYILFQVVFQLLVDYVEDELAWMHAMSLGKAWLRYHFFKIPLAREWGLAHLEWEVQQGDDSPSQSAAAKEIRELYLWFKDVRPNRHDPWDDVPHRDFKTEFFGDGMHKLLPEDQEYLDLASNAMEIDDAYEEEDTDMLCRVMKVRRALWT